jgi:hypothetical protein
MKLSRTGFTRLAAAAALAVAAGSSVARAEAPKTIYSVSAGIDFTSHFISFGADVWGGGDDLSPFSSDSTMFGYTTLTAKFSDQWSGSVNIWSDLNNNTESGIGGNIQEIDFNVGVAYTWDKLTFGLTVGQWVYASDVEGILDFSVAFNDKDLLIKDFAFNPSLLVHYRFDPNGGQKDDAAALVLGIAPGWTFNSASQYPISLTIPASVAFFTDEFQGGDSGFGYANVGVKVGVPLAFIPAEYGAWNASAQIQYYYTPDDSIPNNPEESFFVSTLSVGVSF